MEKYVIHGIVGEAHRDAQFFYSSVHDFRGRRGVQPNLFLSLSAHDRWGERIDRFLRDTCIHVT